MFRNWIIRTVWALGVLSAQSATYYVDCNRPDNTGDGLSWATAKRTIQAAVNAAASGDTIRVGPGTYGEGTTVTPSGATIRDFWVNSPSPAHQRFIRQMRGQTG